MEKYLNKIGYICENLNLTELPCKCVFCILNEQ